MLALSLASTACGVLPGARAVVRTGDAAGVLGLKAAVPSALRLITLPEAGDGVVQAALRQARTSIKLQVYMVTHQGVVDELLAAKARGVDVQVMLEQNPFNQPRPSGKPGAKPPVTNMTTAARLQAAGVWVGWGAPTFTFTHAKVCTIDGAMTLVSTANFTRTGLNADGGGSREFIVEDRNPADVAEFTAIFNADKARTPFHPQNPNLVVSPDNSRAKLFALMQAAHHTLDIQVEVAGDDALDAVIAAKVREGVRVRVLLTDLNGRKTPGGGGNTDSFTAWQKGGAQVRFQDSPHLHAKEICADGQVLYVGSENLSTTSLNQNRELGLLINQVDVVSQVRAVFEKDWAAGRLTDKAPATKKPKKKHKLIGGQPAPDEDEIDTDEQDAIDEDPV